MAETGVKSTGICIAMYVCNNCFYGCIPTYKTVTAVDSDINQSSCFFDFYFRFTG